MTDPPQRTSYHVRQARDGDRQSLEWIVERFSPILLANARYRLRGPLRTIYDPEDIVQEVWATVIPRLPDLTPQDERYTPVFMKFLSTTLLFRMNKLTRKHITGKPQRAKGGGSTEETERDPLDALPADVSGAVTRLVRRETEDAVHEAIQKLDARDREVLILRGIEQHRYEEIATLLGEGHKSLAVRYSRALEKLRRLLPGSIFEEFAAA